MREKQTIMRAGTILGPIPLIIGALLGYFCITASGQDIEAIAKQLETEIIAPCCWRQPVSVHESSASFEVRQEIRELLAQGLSREAVLDRFVKRYGARILAAPPTSGWYRTAYWIPGLAVLLGVILVFLYWRDNRASSSRLVRASGLPPRSEDLERVRREVLG